MKSNNSSFRKHCERLLKIVFSFFFVLLAGFLFWQGFNPIFWGIELGLPIKEILLKGLFMLLLNITGAIVCLMYAIMPFLPDIFSRINKKNEDK